VRLLTLVRLGTYRSSVCVRFRNKQFIKTYDIICTWVKQQNSSTQIHEVNMMKKPSSDRHNNQICLPVVMKHDDKHVLRETCFTVEELCEHDSSFGKLLVHAVDEGLSALGESGRQVVYACLETNFGIRRNDIPGRVDEFSAALHKIFGDSAKLLEIRIMKNLYMKVGDIAEYFQEKEDITFTEYVAAAELSRRSK